MLPKYFLRFTVNITIYFVLDSNRYRTPLNANSVSTPGSFNIRANPNQSMMWNVLAHLLNKKRALFGASNISFVFVYLA
jgi:hypothetical protein